MKNDAEITIRLPHEFLEALEKLAVLNTVSTEIRYAIAEYLARKTNSTSVDTATAKRAIRERANRRAANRAR